MPSAIVTGATGILGREVLFALARNPEIWQTVHALSRSQKEQYPPNVKHDHVDLLGNAKEIAKQLEGVEAEYIFFTAYLQQDTEQENWDVNGALLQNFLDALAITGAEKKLKRLILTTGCKQYGVHLGPTKVPMEEADPWLTSPEWPPNFYYKQQDILKDASQGKSWDWVVTYPNDVIGVAKGNFMNLATSIGIYAAVTKELNQPLVFPGSPIFYTLFDSFTYSRLHAKFNLWAALEPKCSDQAFNMVNGDVESWSNIWPKLAKRFGVVIPENQFSLPAPLRSEMQLADKPPIAVLATEMGISDRVSPGKVVQQVDLVKWSKQPEVKKAWETLAVREGLDKDAFEKSTWAFLGFVLGREYPLVISMSKARKLGWTGYIDSWDAFTEAFDELVKEKVLPANRK